MTVPALPALMPIDAGQTGPAARRVAADPLWHRPPASLPSRVRAPAPPSGRAAAFTAFVQEFHP